MIDMFQSGWDLALSVNVDFTASNCEQNQSESLHYLDDDKPNIYQTLIKSLGERLNSYSKSGRLEAHGFGGIPF
jgi:hypothetical protein